MAEDRYFYIFHKEMDYRRGQLEGLAFEEGMLCPCSDGAGCFLSRLLDSREKGMEWHRLRLKLPEGGETGWKLDLYCSDSPVLETGEGSLKIGELLEARGLSVKEKLELMKAVRVKSIRGMRDVLLHDVKGRYLWFSLETEGGKGRFKGIREIRIDFPRRSFLKYLPEAYQREEKSRDFLERYLGIFQSFYEDMTEQIEKVSWWFDPDSAGTEFLAWMAEWIALEDIPIWNEEQLRYLMKHSMELYRIRGTAEYLKRMIGLYTGCESFVVESFRIYKNRNYTKDEERLKEMYGKHAYSVTVLINTGRLTDKKEYRTLMQIAEHAVPANIECRIILLQQYIFLDRYSYLGVNSRLGQYRPIQLDGLSAMHFARIEKNNGEEAVR